MLRYAFRLHRWGLVGYGALLAFSTYVQSAAFQQSTGGTAAGRATFARSMNLLAAQLPYLLPPAHRLDTLAGYVAWRAYGAMPLVFAVWAVAAATGAVRGDEEKQLVDTWLARGISRARLVATRLGAFGAAALLATVVGGLFAMLGAASVEPLNAGAVAAQTFALWLFTITCFAICVLLAQLFATTRGAQMLCAAAMVVLYMLDVVGRTQPSLRWLAWLSPFTWYEATDVLVPGGHLDVAGVLLSAGVTLAAAALAALAFARRDVRGPLIERPAREQRVVADVAPSPLLGWPVARLLYRERTILLGWASILAVMAVFMVSITRSAVDSLLAVPGLRGFLTHGAGGDPYRAFIASFWFGFAQLLLAGFAIHLVSTWGADDTEGILASELSAPRHRWAVLLERAAAAVIGIVALVAIGSVSTYVAAAAAGTSLDVPGVVKASLLLVPFALTFAAVGAMAVAQWPRAVVGVLGGLAFLSYMVAELGPLLRWPAWVTNLSVFQLYGTPLLTGVNWGGLWAMAGVVVIGFAIATALLQRREVAG